ncbi:hypothetical protein [Plebeiibacterium sediminum]|uniref:DinB family protein n=1 Tax=Plebeiibacterium sediminum TaxID=2992112 RepID=A0AAE3M5W4_9BACT|nr:hypothetical protein [Plebeiobacterium sediminum]MCW3787754.1 hypothetical protein [Plebeiobacterium sediminum]
MNTQPDFTSVKTTINKCLSHWEKTLLELNDIQITQNRNKQHRNIKQILGHLIDSASNNHQRMVRLQYSKELVFPDYQQDNDLWIQLQQYEKADWFNLIQLWKYYNLHIIQMIDAVDIKKLNNTWKNFEGETTTLKQMIEGYPEHLLLHMNEIQELLEL